VHYPRPIRSWQIQGKPRELGRRTWVMAILNLTPDSFYAPSRIGPDLESIRARAERALAAGADLLDLGAESTRPGASPLAPDEEQARLLPALADLRRFLPGVLLSVDTRHAATAARALAAGADIINDVSGLDDPAMGAVLAASACGVILMHHRGDFASMHRLPPLPDPVACVREGLASLAHRAARAGLAPVRLMLDPGFGFGKNLDENFPLLAHFDEFHALGFPLLVGMSRKSFLRRGPQWRPVAAPGPLSPPESASPPEDRLAASLAAATAAALAGAHVVRVHDVAPTLEALRIADRIIELGNL